MRVGVVVFFSLFAASAVARTEIPPYHYVGLMAGQSQIVLGSSQLRNAAAISYGYAKPEPQFRIGSIGGSLVLEGYLHHSYSIQAGQPGTPSDALGFLYFARWQGRASHSGIGAYFEFGWGFQYADRATTDLPSEINSTPWLGAGMSFPFRGREASIGLRFLHISNAGLVTPNRGQDELLLTLQFKV